MSSHYSAALNPNFASLVEAAAVEVADQFQSIGKGYPVLCYTGFSGITLGTMLAHYLRHYLRDHPRVEQFYVRKKNEKSHGSYVEFSSSDIGPEGVPIFVDDFIGSGDTLNWVMDQVEHFYKQKGIEDHTFPWGIQKAWTTFKIFNYGNPAVMPRILVGPSTKITLNENAWKNLIL